MKNSRKIIFIVIILLILAYIVGIIYINNNKKEKRSDNKLNIIASFYPTYIATLNIADGVDDVNLTSLTQPTAGCLHDYQLSPVQLASIENADVFVINGASMESFLDKVIKSYPNLKIVTASDNIELLKDKNGGENPHVWVSISKYIEQVENIKNGLVKIDSKNAEKYSQNAEKYIAKLESLDQKMKDELKDITKKDIVTFHEAFPYFAQEFGLNIVSVIEREPGTEPSPDELVDTIKQVKNSNVKVLFAEPQYSQNSAEVIAKETGAKVYTLDPAVTGEPDKDSYINIMNKNLQVLKEALK